MDLTIIIIAFFASKCKQRSHIYDWLRGFHLAITAVAVTNLPVLSRAGSLIICDVPSGPVYEFTVRFLLCRLLGHATCIRRRPEA